MDDRRTRIGEIIQDYADGLLDSREDAVEAIIDALGGEELLKAGADYLEKNRTWLEAKKSIRPSHSAGQTRKT